jgi:23S rRNA (guanosine2251-2'-O)-methyltransferase
MRHTKKPAQSFRHSDKAGKPAHKSYGKPVKKHGDAPTKSFAKSPAKSMRSPRPPVQAEGRQEKLHQDSILIWGVHAVRAAWLNPKRKCYRLWMTGAGKESFAGFNAEAHEQLLKRPDPKIVDRQTIDRLVPLGSVHQGLILETAPLHQLSLNELIDVNPPPDLLLVLDQVTDPHNVGAILRSAEAFGAGGVIMTERNAPDTTGVLAKTASGALDYIPLISVVNLARTLDELHEAGYWSVGLAEEGVKELAEIDLTGRTVLLLGAEGQGLRQLTRKKCHELARLPTGGPIGSLNVSNAAAVALYEVKRQRKT